MARYSELTNIRPVVNNNGILTQESRDYFNNLQSLPVVTGTGSPEGVVPASLGALYMDGTGTTGSILYIKKLNDIGGDTSQGWLLV